MNWIPSRKMVVDGFWATDGTGEARYVSVERMTDAAPRMIEALQRIANGNGDAATIAADALKVVLS